MLAARAQCPIDRLDDAMLLTDAVAAHAARYVSDEHVVVTVATDDDGLELRVGELGPGNARRMVDDGDLPGVGNVFERIADEIRPAPGAEGDELVLRLRFRP
jgi:serine/threonine-protein kinase RsbW